MIVTRFALPLCAALTLSACATISTSRLNPLNWFSSSQPVVVQTGPLQPLVPVNAGGVVDSRALIAQIATLRVDRTPDGALVTATGIAATQGGFNAQLVPINSDSGTLTLAFRVETPTGFQATGAANSRAITASRVLSAADLAGIRTIQVQSASNARTVSR